MVLGNVSQWIDALAPLWFRLFKRRAVLIVDKRWRMIDFVCCVAMLKLSNNPSDNHNGYFGGQAADGTALLNESTFSIA
jgi:hypothetical protein